MSLAAMRIKMPRKHHKPEEIVAKLRQVDVLTSQGKSVADDTAETYQFYAAFFLGWGARGANGRPSDLSSAV
jgi:hypothetical protein